MTLRTGNRRADSSKPRAPGGGFTLIELILVMTLIVVAAGLMYPVLSGFFRGRVMDAEARRLLGLTRYAQERAASEGIPMVMWFDTAEGRYGLEAAVGHIEEDTRALEFELDRELSLEVGEPPLLAAPLLMNRSTPTAGLRSGTRERDREIRFHPDGFVDESSPEYVVLRWGEKDSTWLVQSTNRASYALQTNAPSSVRR